MNKKGVMPNEPDAAFKRRSAANAKIKRVNNASLYAGSPMYYYCRGCGAQMVLPETHTCVAPSWCNDCIREGRRVAAEGHRAKPFPSEQT